MEKEKLLKKLTESWYRAYEEAAFLLGIRAKEKERLPLLLESETKKNMIAKRGSRFLFLSGAAGVGKGAVSQVLEKRGWEKIPNVMTRRLRPGEVNGKDIIHMSEAEFEKTKNAGLFIQSSTRARSRHGLLRSLLLERVQSGRLIYMDKSVPSTLDLLGKPEFAKIKWSAIYLLPPSPQELFRRLEGRLKEAPMSPEEYYERVTKDLEEFPKRLVPYDAFVVNDKIERAALIIHQSLAAY